MKRTFIITRPEEDATRFIAAAERAGYRVLRAPLLSIRFREEVALPDADWQAVAITSANGARAIARHAARDRIVTATAVTVGPASTQAAKDAGFTDIVQAARGDVGGLIATIRERFDPAAGPLLYAAGAVTRGDLQGELARSGFEVRRVVIYEALRADRLPDDVTAHLRAGEPATVALYSPRSAIIWAELLKREDLSAARLAHACLSENVAAVVRERLPAVGRIITAPRPEEGALLAMLGLAA